MSVKEEKTEEVVEKAIENLDNQVKGLSQDQALSILIQAVKLAQKRGAFELEETEVLLKAVKLFTPSK